MSWAISYGEVGAHVPKHPGNACHGFRRQVLLCCLTDGGLCAWFRSGQGTDGHRLVDEGLVQPCRIDW